MKKHTFVISIFIFAAVLSGCSFLDREWEEDFDGFNEVSKSDWRAVSIVTKSTDGTVVSNTTFSYDKNGFLENFTSYDGETQDTIVEKKEYTYIGDYFGGIKEYNQDKNGDLILKEEFYTYEEGKLKTMLFNDYNTENSLTFNMTITFESYNDQGLPASGPMTQLIDNNSDGDFDDDGENSEGTASSSYYGDMRPTITQLKTPINEELTPTYEKQWQWGDDLKSAIVIIKEHNGTDLTLRKKYSFSMNGKRVTSYTKYEHDSSGMQLSSRTYNLNYDDNNNIISMGLVDKTYDPSGNVTSETEYTTTITYEFATSRPAAEDFIIVSPYQPFLD